MTSLQAIVSSWCASASRARGTWLSRAGLALVAAIISGCIPIPLPLRSGPLADTRTNVPPEVPSSIAIGHTTRREVLLELGEPDGTGPADQWYTYGSAISRGGTGIVMVSYGVVYVARQSVEFRRLLVQFDDAGVVSDVRLDTKRCPFWESSSSSGGSSDVASVPCLDLRGGDVGQQAGPTAEGNERATLNEPAASTVPTAGEAILGHYKNVIRREGDCPVFRKPHLNEAEDYPTDLQVFPDALLFTIPARRQKHLSAFIEHPSVSTRVPLAQIESVEAVKRRVLWAWVNVHMKDGTCASVQFTGYKKALEAAQLIQQHIDGK